MNITLFSQIIQTLDRTKFSTLVKKYKSDKHQKGINSWTHLVSMLFCHLSKANSLREISNGLKSSTGNLNHLGIMKKSPSKSALSYINMHRCWELFRDYYYSLLEDLHTSANFRQVKFKIKSRKILLLDSTIISLCLSLYDWAKYTQSKGAIKLHALLDFNGCLPSYVHITEGKVADITVAKGLRLPSDSVVVADRGYIDFELLNRWHKESIQFVIRLKDSISHIDYGENPLPDGKDEHILIDEKILLAEPSTRAKYPRKLRRVVVYDSKNNTTIELITNNLTWTASTIAELYKQRWMIEIFFKEIKNHLKIKTFVGTSENAVMIQIWTALITILILKYLKNIAKYKWCLSNLIAFLRMNLFVKLSLQDWLDRPFNPPEEVSAYDLKLQFGD